MNHILDKHHTRALFTVSQADDYSTHFSVFMNGVVYDQPNVKVEVDSQIVPYFSTSERSQFIIMDSRLTSL